MLSYLTRHTKYEERWDASRQQAIERLSRAEQKQLHEVLSAAEAQGNLDNLIGAKLSATDQEALLLIKMAISSLETFMDLSKISMNLRIDTEIIWGFSGLIFKVSNPENFHLPSM
jgi:hypothetical protein